jgi:hypothetical protein
VGGCLPDFAWWSGYHSIAALTIDPEIDVMGQFLPHAPAAKTASFFVVGLR